MSLGWGNDKVFDAISRCEQIEREKKMAANGDMKWDGLSNMAENIFKRFSIKQNSNNNKNKNISDQNNNNNNTANSDSNAETDMDGKSLPVWRLFVRKEVFYPWDDDVINDSLATHLCYVQLCRSLMIGECACDKVIDVSCVLMCVSYGLKCASCVCLVC